MKPTSVLLTLLLTASISGCISDEAVPEAMLGDDASAAALQAKLDAAVAGLGCTPDHTKGQTSANFGDIADHFEDDVRYGEIDVIDGTDLMLVARYSPGGFDLFNVSDPYAPQLVSSYNEDQTSYFLDVKVSSDGKTAVLGGFGSFEVIDLSDRAAPERESIVQYPVEADTTMAQSHMLHFADIEDETYLFAASQWGQGVLIFHMTGDPGARAFEFLTYFAPAVGGPLAAHDMMVQHDETAGFPILWVANGFGGFIAADVSDPARPVPVSYTPELDPYQGYTHTISVTEIDGTRYAFTMAELGAMALKVYDVTNLATPLLLGTWTIDDVPTATQHNTQIMGDHLWLGHYGNGFVKFRISDILDSLTLPAYNIGPLSDITPFAQWLPPEGGSVWETVVVNGVHYTTAGGLFVTLDGCHAAGDRTLRAYV